MKTTVRARVRFEMDVEYVSSYSTDSSVDIYRRVLIDHAKRLVQSFADSRLIGEPDVLRLTITVEEPEP
jgi:hypothetical protein